MPHYIFSAIILALSLLHPINASAHDFDRIVSFGDSFTDISNNGPGRANYLSPYMKIELLQDQSGRNAAPWFPLPYAVHDSLSLSGTGALQGYGTSGSSINQFGGRVQFKSQVDSAILTKFRQGDLVLINIGINDADVLCNSDAGPVKCRKFGTSAADMAADQVKRLIENGARTIVYAAFSSAHHVRRHFAKYPDSADAFSDAYLQQLKAKLPPLTSSGSVIYLIDTSRFYDQLKLNPEHYDFDFYSQPCAPLAPDCIVTSGSEIHEYKNGAGEPWQLKHVLHDDLHPSTGGFKALAGYIVELVKNPGHVPPAATLIGNAETLRKDIEVAGDVIFYQEKAGILENLSGTGTLVKMGPGALTVKHGDFFKGPRRRLEGGLSVLLDRI